MSEPLNKNGLVHQAIRTAREGLQMLAGLSKGVMVCGLIALCALFIAEHHGGPVLLYALLLGLAFNFLGEQPAVSKGVAFSARTLLRLGVALLGARITLDKVIALGAQTAWLTIAGVGLSIGTGLLLARMLHRSSQEGLLSGCAVGICGASAALAVSAVLPQTRENERFTLMTIIGVTLMSTFAMIAYPLLVQWLQMSASDSGVFLGATIHDVAQVVGAASMLGPAAADSAVVVKLLRVMMLTPVVVVISLVYRQRNRNSQDVSMPILPGFLIAFISLMLLSSVGLLNADWVKMASDASRALLVVAIAAAGIKTSVREMLQLGWRPAALIATETIGLAIFIGLGLWVLRPA